MELERLFHMALAMSVDRTTNSCQMVSFWVSDDCRERCVQAGDPHRGPLDFGSFFSIAVPQQTSGLARLGLRPYIFNRHIGIYSAGCSQGFRTAETMVGGE